VLDALGPRNIRDVNESINTILRSQQTPQSQSGCGRAP
jgi:hypothetical protein